MANFPLSQFAKLPYPTESFEGQTIIVTGANTGLGLEAARHFTRLNAAKVILGCRSISKGEEAALSIAETTGRKDICEVWQVDLGNFDSVKRFTERAAKLDRLDIVCENAGLAALTYREVEGMESTIAVNVVGTFLMALNFLPILRRSGKTTGTLPKLVITTSDAHFRASLTERREDSIFEALKKNEKEYMAGRYPNSKLLEIFFVQALAEQVRKGPHASERVIINLVNPGFCRTTLSREATGLMFIMFWLMKIFIGRTVEAGSRTLVASAAGGPETHGKYMSECSVKEPSEFVRSEEGQRTQERVYTELIEILEKIQPGITKNI
ncbi:NAD(P)-binding protein [Stipitochalara longipes BDJ]|nr:NAD(P)-binding protein [Stipitochalara longipes BDJ]